MRPAARTALQLGAITALGLALRLASYGNSLFGDELSSYYIVTGHSMARVIHILHGHSVDLTPPLYYVLTWSAERLGESVQGLRIVSLLAGTAAIPFTFLLGRATVGERAGIVASALVALSPFLIFYSTEARAYALLMFLLLAVALSLVQATRTRRVRWWVAYSACSCAVLYTHYTSVNTPV